MDTAADTAGIGCGLYSSRFPESARQLHGSRLKGFHHRADGPHAISIHAACLVVAWGGSIFGIPGRHIDLARLTHTSRGFSYSLRYADRNCQRSLAVGFLRWQRWVRVSAGIARYVSCTFDLGRRHGLIRPRALKRTKKITLKNSKS